MAAILSSARIGENFGCHHGKTEGVVELPISVQSGDRGHHLSAKPKQEAAVGIDRERFIIWFTHRERHQ